MLEKIIRFSIKNKLVVCLFTVALVVWGVWSATRLPIDAVPDITNNQVQIITVSPTLAGQEVEQFVTFPIEQSITNLPNIDEIRSISRFGLSVVTVVFKDEVDIYFARQLVSERLKEALENIPNGVGTPELAPVSTGLGEIYQYIIRNKEDAKQKYSDQDLRTIQDWIVARQLYGIEGVAEINSFGGKLKQYEVSIDPYRLKAMNVSITDIFEALQSNNENTGGAYIDKKPNAYFIRGIGLVSSLEDVGNITIKNPTGNTPILIKDVATVRFGSAIRYGGITYNGEGEVVGGIVMMLKGENSNTVVKRVKQKIADIEQSLPEGVVIEPYLDRTDLVGRAIATVEKNLLEGALIVIFVLVLFLGNLRAGLIVASAIPLSLLFALAMMNLFGVSANLMSLGAIDFGLIVDGAVIIVEATMHHLGLRQSSRRLTQAEMDNEVLVSASKIRNSAAFGEIIILIVYIPILTLSGIEGKMFAPMAQTVGFAILGALILSLTYIPMMSAIFLSKKIKQKANFSDKIMNRLQKLYQPVLVKALGNRVKIVIVTFVFLIVSLLVFSGMGGEFMPQLKEGDFAMHCILPQGSSLSQSIETSQQAMKIIKSVDEVDKVVGKTGSAEVPTDPMPPEATDIMIILKPRAKWKNPSKSYEQLAKEIEAKLTVMPGIFFEMSQPIQMRFNELMTGIRQDVAVKIFGENLDTLAHYANLANSVIATVEGATQPQVERVSGLPQINVEYNRTRLGNYGLTIADANNALSTAFAGKVAGQVFENERRFDLVVRLDSVHRTDISDVGNLLLTTKTGVQIPFSQIANIDYKLGPAQISREEGKRRIVIGFNVSGRDVQSVVEEIKERLGQEVKLPSGYYYTYGGQFENLQKASNRLMIAVPISLLLIFVLLFFTFHSVKQAMLIFTAIPMSAIGGIFALLVRDMPFSISAGIGFIALFGVAVLNGIVLIGTFNQLEKEGVTDLHQRVIEGTKTRLRPVLMTAMVASLGFLPMAISTSAGAEVQKPLATVVIGGLISATILTLFVLPILYIVFSTKINFREMVMKKRAIASLLVLLVVSISAKAQHIDSDKMRDVRSLSIDQVIDIALKNNLNLKAKSLEVESAKVNCASSFELPKAEVNYAFGNTEGFEYNDGFNISQTIPFPTLFVHRYSLAKEQYDGKKLEKELFVVELKNLVRSYFYEIEYLTHRNKYLQQLDSIYVDLVRIAELRFHTGEVSKLDISTAHTKYSEVALLYRQNEVSLENAYQNLYSLLQSDEKFLVRSEGEYMPLMIEEVVDSTMVDDTPEVQLFLQEAKIARQNSRVEISSLLPDFTIGYNNVSSVGLHSPDGVERFYDRKQRFSSFEVGVAIPLSFGSSMAKIKAFRRHQQASKLSAQWQKRQLQTELQNRLSDYKQALQQYEYFKNMALPNASEIISVAKLGYQTGEISYIESLYAIQTAIDIYLNYLNSIQQINQLTIKIYSLINR
ncbi:MAG: CusA/CzcA family heavy metal efflux RND transporter [Bacteroidales bacterium]|nr:MAG: CusA/CzcA family heavy metal efflux RND transporter [Bacteroidales bacterium]